MVTKELLKEILKKYKAKHIASQNVEHIHCFNFFIAMLCTFDCQFAPNVVAQK